MDLKVFTNDLVLSPYIVTVLINLIFNFFPAGTKSYKKPRRYIPHRPTFNLMTKSLCVALKTLI